MSNTVLTTFVMDTPIGKIKITADKQAIYKTEYAEIAPEPPQGYPKVINFAIMYLQAAKTTNFIMKQAIKEIAAYFDQGARSFELPISLDKSDTPFEIEVWEMLRTIPYGVTVTAADIARHMETEDVPAVCAAIDGNPLPLIIPAHRVVEAVLDKNPALGDYAGGRWRKEWLLHHERISQGRLKRDII